MKSRTPQHYPHFCSSYSLSANWYHGLNRVKKHILGHLCKKYPEIFRTIGNTLLIAILFIAGAYFFLVQLAEYGW